MACCVCAACFQLCEVLRHQTRRGIKKGGRRWINLLDVIINTLTALSQVKTA